MDKDLYIELLEREVGFLRNSRDALNGIVDRLGSENDQLTDIRHDQERSLASLRRRLDETVSEYTHLEREFDRLRREAAAREREQQEADFHKTDPFELLPSLTQDQLNTVVDHLQRGDFIPAIRWLREQSDPVLGLKEAKHVVDVIRAHMRAGTLPTQGGIEQYQAESR